MTTREQVEADFDRLAETALKVKRDRDALLNALEHLLNACHTSSDDNRLNEAQIMAAKAIEQAKT